MTQKPKKKQKIFIEALEQRIMLDGAGASTFLDLIDERNQEEIKNLDLKISLLYSIFQLELVEF